MKLLRKSILPAFVLSLGLALSASAADIPQSGLYVGKDGAPLAESQKTAPAVRKTKMAEQNQAVVDAMKALPHDAEAVVTFTVNEDGAAVNPVISESSGSIILDQYALDSVLLWQFIPSQLGDKTVSSAASVPIHFVSTMVAVPAVPTAEILKDPTDAEQAAAERAGHPGIPVQVYVTAEGKPDGKPEAQKVEGLSPADFKILAKYAEKCVEAWTFTPAQNPDGEAIGADVVVTVQL